MVKKSLLPYGLSSSDPHIELPDVIGFKDEWGSNASQYFNEKLNELKREYEALVQQARDTQLVYNAEYNFVPKHIYTPLLQSPVCFLLASDLLIPLLASALSLL